MARKPQIMTYNRMRTLKIQILKLEADICMGLLSSRLREKVSDMYSTAGHLENVAAKAGTCPRLSCSLGHTHCSLCAAIFMSTYQPVSSGSCSSHSN
jgi:hypothetical protein